jgi:exopolysaccharide biosynthesis polyprenyl glycosylphosphotransferase
MKRADLLFAFLLLPTDLLAALLGFTVAYLLRANVEIPPVTYLWPIESYLQFILFTLPVWALVFALSGMYDVKSLRSGTGEMRRIFLGVTAGMALVVLGIFFTRTTFFSRLIILYAYLLTLSFVFLGRHLIRALQRYSYQYGTGIYRLMVFGSGGLAESVVRALQQNPQLGYRLVALVTKRDLPRLRELIHQHAVDELLIIDPTLSTAQLSRLVSLSEEERFTLKQVPDLLEVKATQVHVGTLAGIPLVEFKKTKLDGWGRIAKRIFDVALASAGLVLLFPFLLLIAAAIKLDSPGPVIYKNKRVGPTGLFSTYKFRSMYVQYSTGAEYGGQAAEEMENQLIAKKNVREGPIFKIKDDPRRTRVGRFLERTSLDELPQLLNVVLGNMSLIGPRPHMPKEVIHYESAYKKLLHVKPGLTGLAQISGRSDLSTEEEVRLDTYYVENWSPWMDLMILLKTPWALIRRRRTAS